MMYDNLICAWIELTSICCGLLHLYLEGILVSSFLVIPLSIFCIRIIMVS